MTNTRIHFNIACNGQNIQSTYGHAFTAATTTTATAAAITTTIAAIPAHVFLLLLPILPALSLLLWYVKLLGFMCIHLNIIFCVCIIGCVIELKWVGNEHDHELHMYANMLSVPRYLVMRIRSCLNY